MGTAIRTPHDSSRFLETSVCVGLRRNLRRHRKLTVATKKKNSCGCIFSKGNNCSRLPSRKFHITARHTVVVSERSMAMAYPILSYKRSFLHLAVARDWHSVPYRAAEWRRPSCGDQVAGDVCRSKTVLAARHLQLSPLGVSSHNTSHLFMSSVHSAAH